MRAIVHEVANLQMYGPLENKVLSRGLELWFYTGRSKFSLIEILNITRDQKQPLTQFSSRLFLRMISNQTSSRGAVGFYTTK